MKKILFMAFCILLLTGCVEQVVTEAPDAENSPEKVTETVVEEVAETEVEENSKVDFGVSDAVLTELERATKNPSYAYGKKISDGYTREDYASVTKIEDGDDKFYTYEIVMKDGEKTLTSFRKFLVD